MKSWKNIPFCPALSSINSSAYTYRSLYTSNFQTVQRGEDFTLSTLTELTDVHWWGNYHSPNPPIPSDYMDAFTIRIFDILQGEPQVEPFYEVAVENVKRIEHSYQSPVPTFYYYYYEYDAQIAPLLLDPGVYMLSIVNDGAWGWLSSDHRDGLNWRRLSDGTPWEPEPGHYPNPAQERAFYLTGNAVPEPGTMFLLGIGLLGLVGFSRKLKQ